MRSERVLTFIFLIFLLLAADKAQAGLILQSPSYTGLANGLVGYWSFDGRDMAGNVAYDRSGQGNNGTLTGPDRLPVRDGGKIGQALEFKYPGSGCFGEDVTINQSSSINNLSSLTVSAWIKPRSLGAGGQGQIITKSTAAGIPVNGWSFYVGDTGTARIFGLKVDYNTTDLEAFSDSSVPQINFNEWQHVLITWDGSASAANIKLYKNGIAVPKNNFANGADTRNGDSGSNLFIGNNPSDCRTFDGFIDEVRVYNRVLSADEIKRLYRIGGTLRVNTQINNDSLSKGLVGYWSFDAKDVAGTNSNLTIYDKSGNNNTATSSQGRAATRAIGKLGQSLSFDGSDDYVTVGTAKLATLSAFSIAYWIKPDLNSVNNDPGTYCEGPGNCLSSIVAGISSQKSELCINDGSFQCSSGSRTLSNNVWQHVVMTFESGKGINFYLDGTSDGSDSTNSNPSLTATGARIGNSGSNAAEYCKCVIDEFRLYNRALSPDEIKRLYRIGATLHLNSQVNTDSLQKGLVGWWTFDGPDMARTIAYNRAGQSNNGTLQNGPKRAFGKLGQALEFDGVNDQINLGVISALESASQATVSAWVKARVPGVSGVDSFYVGKDAGGEGFRMEIEGGFLNMVVDTGVLAYGQVALTDTEWHHIVMVFDGTKSGNAERLKGYVDGVKQSLSFPAGNIPATTGSTGATSYINQINGHFGNGWVDDVRIYSRALTPDEIKRLYRIGGGIR